MRICGIKLRHDGAIALIEDRRLVFCVEQEKLNNNLRYQAIEDLDAVVAALAEHGLNSRDVDQFVIDGGGDGQCQVRSGAKSIILKWGPYVEPHAEGLLTSYNGTGLILEGRAFSYRSYSHLSGHVASAYCTSPFAESEQSAFCLVWDGSILPRLYHVERRGARFLECLFPIVGHAYAVAGDHFGPYKDLDRKPWDLGIAGKLMAYIALGSAHDEIVTVFRELYKECFASDTQRARRYRAEIESGDWFPAMHAFFRASASQLDGKRDEDILASFHSFLEHLLVEQLAAAVQRHAQLPGRRNLCIAGGCGLNIKWNSAVRSTGLFDVVWVPPFPNDSGAAIGAACAALAERRGFVPLEWSVYSGPRLRRTEVPPGWKVAPCNVRELAIILASNKPVIFLASSAELGPRALGGRSILAAATSVGMKDHLNEIKRRESFRPVAPICIEDRAPEIFCPGTPDPYMLFDHQTKAEWLDKVPAVVHLDGSARLQTVSRTSSHKIAELLVAYEELTGIPLLCNTSANLNGRGFFPDATAACQWGRVDHVWSDGLLWTKAA
ncbi:carbamoyltransferase [Bradyrhizobium sp. LB12.1]|uniref:nodulation protein NodU n=1 Tax=Bradyrhizobium sp. LB12.1 TaxID=3156327 RepID=UPI0033962BA0